MRAAAAVLTAAAWLALAGPTYGCSCAVREPREAFQAADAAMVGVLEERREPQPEGERYSSADPVTLVFRVERDYKADLGGRLEVRTARDGASCGIEADVGDRIGLYLRRDGDTWTSNLCAQASPEEIEMAAEGWPRARGRGRLSFLVGGQFGLARIVGLGRRGRLLAYGRGAGHATDIAVCPGSQRSVELFIDSFGSGLAVRSLRTLRVVRSVRLPDMGHAGVVCGTPSGRTSYVAALRPNGSGFSLLRVEGKRTTVTARGKQDVVALEPLSLFVTSNESRPLLSWISPQTGRRHRLRRLERVPSAATASPDGRRIAVLTRDYTGQRTRPHIALLDWGGHVRSVRRLPWEPDVEPGLVWLDGTRLLMTRYGSRAQLFDDGLEQLQSVRAFSGDAAVLGGRVYARYGSALLRWDPGSNDVARLHRLPAEQTGPPIAVPGGPHVTSPARTAKRRCR